MMNESKKIKRVWMKRESLCSKNSYFVKKLRHVSSFDSNSQYCAENSWESVIKPDAFKNQWTWCSVLYFYLIHLNSQKSLNKHIYHDVISSLKAENATLMAIGFSVRVLLFMLIIKFISSLCWVYEIEIVLIY